MKLARCFKNSVFADGLFLTCARMNHSCLPAVHMSSDDEEETEVRALRDILAGEEITVSYLRTSALQGRAERVAKLLAGWNFQCCCQVCELEGEALRRNDLQRKKVRESLEKISDFFDRLARLALLQPPVHLVKLQIKRYFIEAKVNLAILEGELQGQAEPAVMMVLLDLALLAEVARTHYLRTGLPGAARPGEYLARAREKAGELGVMFLSNCATREVEMEGSRVAFGSY
jgi:hypothetical protein